MYVKQCPECKRKSYSSCKKGEWNCPHCDHNLTDEAAQSPKED